MLGNMSNSSFCATPLLSGIGFVSFLGLGTFSSCRCCAGTRVRLVMFGPGASQYTNCTNEQLYQRNIHIVFDFRTTKFGLAVFIAVDTSDLCLCLLECEICVGIVSN